MGEARPFGRYFEDFEIGDVYRHWPGKTITEYDDHLFCMITMNHHPLHTNAHYAETSTQFGRNVVVGNLVYSLALGMSVPDVSGKAIANLEVESRKHTAPMFHGDTLYAEPTVLVEDMSSWKNAWKSWFGAVHPPASRTWRSPHAPSRKARTEMGRRPWRTAFDRSSKATRCRKRCGTPCHASSAVSTESGASPI